MARGVDRRDVYIDDDDRLDFIDRLHLLENGAGAKVLAYCLMGNHFHLAIRVGAVPLSSIMQRLLGRYSRRFNLRHGRAGHLFEARYKAVLCMDESYLNRLIPYIHLNPVRAGLAKTPWEWRWSNYTGTTQQADDLSDFEPWPKEGTREFDLCRDEVVEKISLDSIGEKVRLETGLNLASFREIRYERTVLAARQRFVEEAVRVGYTQLNIAMWLGSTRSAVNRFARNVGCGKPDTKL